MTRQLNAGDRVQYIGDAFWFGPDDKRTGTVVKLYEGYEDREDGRVVPLAYPENWFASVKVDEVSGAWPYPGTDIFAPEVNELKLI